MERSGSVDLNICSTRRVFAPERVTDAVLKEDESLMVYLQKVTTVKVEVSLLEHVSQLLLLRLLLVLGVTAERCSFYNLCHQQTRLSCGQKNRGWILL